MIKYFKEVLKTLKKIEENTREIKEHAELLKRCVRVDDGHGHSHNVSTKNFNS